MNLETVAPIVGSVVTLLIGLMGLASPSAAAALTSVQPVGLIGRSEIRATYGGLFAAMGAYCLFARDPMAYTVLGVAWIGAAVGRVVSVVVDRSTSPKNLGAVVFEAAVGALLLLSLRPPS